MDVKELVSRLSNNLIEAHCDVPFYYYVKKKLEGYISMLSCVDKNRLESILASAQEMCGSQTTLRFINLIKVINQKCLKILQLAYKGNIYKAMELLQELMTKRKGTKGYLNDMYINYLRFAVDEGSVYFRCLKVRANDTPKNCNHLPFNLRYLATANRFNQIGFPCLYLASSLAIAKKESCCTENDNVFVGEFKAKSQLFYLNFCVPSKEEIEKMRGGDVFAFLVTYPLVLLSLIKVENKDAKFHEEYLFSQLFFHLLYTVKIDDVIYWSGIRYSSTCDENGYNLVIPALYNQEEPPMDDRVSDFIDMRFEMINQYKIIAVR